ncbi:SMC family ATPase [Planococcus sp. 11815]|uniref:AAA family ATPase n=1 Tax=Planococcus sp. 11815 TaxID=2939413 RepID=UPI003DA3B010
MEIKKLEICNFKNYQGRVTFDLTKPITILYGDNGYGKSSFFDAIEWCLTNSISRFDGKETEIKKDIINKQCMEEEFSVSVKIEFDKKVLERSFNVFRGEAKNTQTKIILDNKTVISGKENVENYFKKNSFKGDNADVNNYSHLIKSTNILSQDQISDFVTSENAASRYRALVNIMGLRALLNETDNYKKILLGLQKEKEEISKEINVYENSIKSKEEIKNKIVDIELIEKEAFLNVSRDEQKTINYRELIKEYREQKNKEESFISFYNDLKEYNKESVKSVEQKIHLGEIKEIQYRSKISRREKLLKNLNKQNEIITNENNNNKRLSILKKDIMSIEENLKLNNIKESVEELEKKVSKNDLLIRKYEHHIFNCDSIALGLSVVKEKENENKNTSYKNIRLNQQFNKYNLLLKKLKEISDKKESKIMVQLINNVKGIEKYVNENNLKKCPVCSSTPEGSLNHNIQENIIILNEKIKEDTYEMEKLLKLINKLEEKLEFINISLKKNFTLIEKNEALIERLNKEEQEYKENLLYDSNIASYSKDKLNLELNLITEYTQKIKKGIIDKINLHKKSNEFKELTGISQHISYNIVKEKSEIDKNKLNKKISILIINVAKSIDVNKKKLEFYIKSLKSLYRVKSKSEDIVTPINYNKRFNDIYLISLKKAEKLESKILLVEDILEIKRKKEMNKKIEKQITDIYISVKKAQKRIDKLNEVIKLLNEYIMLRSSFFGTETKTFFNQDRSPIQKYFRYLNPIPSDSKLVFDGEAEEINIKISFKSLEYTKDSMRNAKNFLSSGQLNVLAISIFLAINEKQKTNFIDFLAIDDPIQNMDDINQYSICDVLGNIQKQLIFSTHDLDFLKLFINKNDSKKQDLQVYTFTSPYIEQKKVKRLIFD